MIIEIGTVYQISDNSKRNFNSADALTIIRQKGNIVQFTLNGQKGHGSMPLQHLQYLLKKKELIEVMNKRLLLKNETEEEQIV